MARGKSSSSVSALSLFVAAVSSALLITVIPTTHAVISEQCRQESDALQKIEILSFAHQTLLDEYMEDYQQTCDFDLTPGAKDIGCSLGFDGDNSTFTGLCRDKGGKIYQRDVFLRCGVSLATIDHNIGEIPVCVGLSCNTSALQAGDLDDTQVNNFVGNLTFTGCKGEISAATATSSLHFWSTTMLGTAVALVVISLGAWTF